MPPFATRLSCISLFSTDPKSDNFFAKKLLFVHPSQQNPGCMSGSIHCCRYIFQAGVGRRLNKLRNAAGIIGLSFSRLKYRIVKTAHTGSHTRSKNQFLYAKVLFFFSAPSLRLLWQRHWWSIRYITPGPQLRESGGRPSPKQKFRPTKLLSMSP